MPIKSAIKAVTKVSKHDTLLKLLRSNKGVTLAQMQKATGWQPHSIRSFLSGTIKKRFGLTLKSERGKCGERRYLIAGG